VRDSIANLLTVLVWNEAALGSNELFVARGRTVLDSAANDMLQMIVIGRERRGGEWRL